MRIQTASWTSPNVTAIRAEDLWNGPGVDGAESEARKLDRLFSDLRDAATATSPRETQQIRMAQIPLIDQRYQQALADIQNALTTWVAGKPDALRQSGAFSPATGKLFAEYADGEEAHMAYLQLLDRIVEDHYRDARAAFNKAVASGVPAQAAWEVGSWEVERAIDNRTGQLRSIALLWLDPSSTDVAVSGPLREYKAQMRSTIGKTVESADAWRGLEQSYFDAAKEQVEETARISRVSDGALPRDLREARDLLDSRPKVVEEGQLLPLLAIPCSRVNEILKTLDSIFEQVPISQSAIYNRVYTAYQSYHDLRCDSPAKPAVQSTYERVVKVDRDTFARNMQEILDKAWTHFTDWAVLEEKAATAGRLNELEKMKDDAYAAIQSAIAAVSTDPWSGPLGRDSRGAPVPYAGVDIGEALYEDWIWTQANDAHDKIKTAVAGWEANEAELYRVTQSFADSALSQYKRMWDSDPIYGVAAEPGYVGASVIGEAWGEFTAAVQAKIGSTYPSVNAFKAFLQSEYVSAVQKVRSQVAQLEQSTAEKFPDRLAQIEDLAETLQYQSLTRDEVANLLREVELLHSQVPWQAADQSRYDAIYSKLKAYLESWGGPPVVGQRPDTQQYYEKAVAEFEDLVQFDAPFAKWLGLGGDFNAQVSQWKTSVWNGLTQLESRTDAGLSQYRKDQESRVREATDRYIQWRSTLLSTAKAQIEALVQRIASGAATDEEKTRARSGSRLFHPFLSSELQDLSDVVGSLTGARLLGALAPFAKFEPLKSTSGFDVEEYSKAHLQKLVDNWAESRLKDGPLVIEPKINGYRLILEQKDDVQRVYMEGATKDYAKNFPGLVADLGGVGDVILDGELVEKEGARPSLGKYRREDHVDDSEAILKVFDVLYWDGMDYHEKPYDERLKVLDKVFSGRSFKHLEKLPHYSVSSIGDLLPTIEKCDAYPQSEGAMLKTAKSKYPLDRRTSEWAKIKRYSDLQVLVLGEEKTKTTDHVYRCGVLATSTEGIDPSEIEEYKGKSYVVLGNTFRTSVKATPGDVIEVAVSEVVIQKGEKGLRLNWMLPTVKDLSSGTHKNPKPDTVEYAKQVSQLLSASVDNPWKIINDLLTQALSTTSVPKLQELKAKAFTILADLNYQRVARFAWDLVQLIRDRLGQTGQPERIVAEEGRVDDPLVTQAMVDEVRSTVTGIREDIAASAQHKLMQLNGVKKIIAGYKKTATGSVLSDVLALQTEIDSYAKTLADSGTKSLLDIERELSALESKADDLERAQPATIESDAAALSKDLARLAEDAAARQYYSSRIEALSQRLDEMATPLHTTNDVSEWLRLTKAIIAEAIRKIQNGDEGAKFYVTQTLSMDLDRMWRELTPAQQSLFEDDFDGLRLVIKSVRQMQATVGGAILSSARKVDLGCGNAKPAGYYGIDVKGYSGVDKTWDLEKGIPLPTSSVDEIRARHILEHLENPIAIMGEIWRVLKPSGLLNLEVPSTAGEGADADPTHKSRWNALSFAFYSDDQLRETHDIPYKFDILSIEEEPDETGRAIYVRATLKAIKPVVRGADLEGFRAGHDAEVNNPKRYWRQLFAALRYIGDSCYPTLLAGDEWGDWTLDDAAKYFGAVVSALRKVKFPLIPPRKGEDGYDTPYWALYRRAQAAGYVTIPSPDEETAKDWDAERKTLISAELTEAGEAAANNRTDFMADKPTAIPVHGTLWSHVRGIDEKNKGKSLTAMLGMSKSDDVLNIHHDFRFKWGANYLEGFTVFLGNQDDYGKLMKYDGKGKMGVSLKERQPTVWGQKSELDNRLFAPGQVGNSAGKDTWGKMFFVCNVALLPSRMRSTPKGKRYFEFYLKFEGRSDLDGLWALSEEASRSYDMPFMFWRMKKETPFCSREDAKHEKEREKAPDWQCPSEDRVKQFLGRTLEAAVAPVDFAEPPAPDAPLVAEPPVPEAKDEFVRDTYQHSGFGACAEAYSRLLQLGDPHSSTVYSEAKLKADKAVGIAKEIGGGVDCNRFGILVAQLVNEFVEKAERLWKIRKEMHAEKGESFTE